MASTQIIDLVPELRLKAKLLLQVLQQRTGAIPCITQTRRTWQEQAALYAQGRDKPGKIVTNSPAGTSKHETGRAFDIAFRTTPGNGIGAITWEGPWAEAGKIGKELGLTWGGTWKCFKDMCHFQLPEPFRPPTLRVGSESLLVLEARILLQLAPSTHFSVGMTNVVTDFQRRASLEPDGILGRHTWAALYQEASYRAL